MSHLRFCHSTARKLSCAFHCGGKHGISRTPTPQKGSQNPSIRSSEPFLVGLFLRHAIGYPAKILVFPLVPPRRHHTIHVNWLLPFAFTGPAHLREGPEKKKEFGSTRSPPFRSPPAAPCSGSWQARMRWRCKWAREAAQKRRRRPRKRPAHGRAVFGLGFLPIPDAEVLCLRTSPKGTFLVGFGGPLREIEA